MPTAETAFLMRLVDTAFDESPYVRALSPNTIEVVFNDDEPDEYVVELCHENTVRQGVVVLLTVHDPEGRRNEFRILIGDDMIAAAPFVRILLEGAAQLAG